MTGSHSGERLIGVLVPPSTPRRPPPPVPLARLPHRPHPPDRDEVLVDVARLDSSGRLSSRALMRALGWRAGQRIDIAVADHAIVVNASTTGRHMVTAQGEVSLPAPARAMAGLDRDKPVLLIADAGYGQLIVHPLTMVVRMLINLHIGRPDGGHDVD
jgi:bifunctional DNA-binding transcriptional regulator/antitoxin component of YhaV-PrlF toxin-antitoxin module